MNLVSLEQKYSNALAALILGTCIMGSAGIAAFAFYRVHTLDNTLSVTGSATQEAQADSATLVTTLSHSVSEDSIAATQQHISIDADHLVASFIKSGIVNEHISVSPIFVDNEYSSDTNAPRRYNVHADVTIHSEDPILVQKISKNIGIFAPQWSVVSAQAPQYLISSLPEMRVALIGKAVEDAKKRADQIAHATGRSVGLLQSAASGVVQVLARNSVDVSDYGSYDTSTIDKTVMVTARATFYLK